MNPDVCEWLLQGWRMLADNGIAKTLLTTAMVGGTFARFVTLPSTKALVYDGQRAALRFNRAVRVARAISLATLAVQISTVIGYVVLSIQVEPKPEALTTSSKVFLCEWASWLFVGILLGIVGAAASIVAGEVVKRRS